MNIIIEKDYEQLSKTAMQHLLGYIYRNHPTHLAITAGTTPVRMYELLVEELKNKDNRVLGNVTFYNFDEIPYQGKDGYGVTMTNLNNQFFEPAHIDKNRIHILDASNYQQQDDYLKSIGGLDAILLGIGADGHFCGNLPGVTKFHNETVSVSLDDHPELVDALLQEVGGDVNLLPEYYVTMGPKSVMQARHVIMFATGKNKAEIIKKAFGGEITEEVPSSVLQLHPNFTLILDEAAASLLNN